MKDKDTIITKKTIVILIYVFCFVVMSTKLTKPSRAFVSMIFFIIKMIEKTEEIVHDNEVETLLCKISGLKNPKSYVLTLNRLNTFMVLFFSDLGNAQTCKVPYRDS